MVGKIVAFDVASEYITDTQKTIELSFSRTMERRKKRFEHEKKLRRIRRKIVQIGLISSLVIAGAVCVAGAMKTTATETETETETVGTVPEDTEEICQYLEEWAEKPWNTIEGVRIYHYCPCKNCCSKNPTHPAYGITASGARATEGVTVAVDPKIIPLGSEVLINGHVYTAQDTGGTIRGNTVDIYVENHEIAKELGTYEAVIQWR